MIDFFNFYTLSAFIIITYCLKVLNPKLNLNKKPTTQNINTSHDILFIYSLYFVRTLLIVLAWFLFVLLSNYTHGIYVTILNHCLVFINRIISGGNFNTQLSNFIRVPGFVFFFFKFHWRGSRALISIKWRLSCMWAVAFLQKCCYKW